MGGEIPTGVRTVTVKLKCGGMAYVRRLRHSDRNRVSAAAGVTQDLSSWMMFQEFGVRLALQGVDGLTDPEADGRPVAWATERHPQLGALAVLAVFDAMETEDIRAVAREAGLYLDIAGALGGLSDEQRGN